MSIATVSGPYMRVRFNPSTNSPIVGHLKRGATIDFDSSKDVVTSEGLKWIKVSSASIEGMPVFSDQAGTVPAVFFVAQTAWLTLDGQPGIPPVVVIPPNPVQSGPKPNTTRTLLGVHVIDQHHWSEKAVANGAGAATWLNGHGPGQDQRAKYIYRKWLDRRKFGNGAEMWHALEIFPEAGVIYTGLCEGDSYGQNGEDLSRRIRLDIEAATEMNKVVDERISRDKEYADRIKALGRPVYAAGTFSMGEPNFVSEDTCRRIRDELAPAYNRGLLWVDMHLYSPDPDHIFKDPELIWFERRYEFLFTKCGFNPTVRHIICTETGVDTMGLGGFKAWNLSIERFVAWCRRWVEVSQRPIVVRGVSYPSPLMYATIFQLGQINSNSRWFGFGIDGYLDALAQEYLRPG